MHGYILDCYNTIGGGSCGTWMNLTVVGGGYVGLVSAVCFCEFGFEVCLVEQDSKKLELLKVGKSTLYEPGLAPILHRHIENKRLVLSDDFAGMVANSDAIMVAVSTSPSQDIDLDLTLLNQTIKVIASALIKGKYVGIFIKSSVPVGTCSIVAENIRFIRPDLIAGQDYDVIANPSFLREGSAIQDFMSPDIQLIGLNRESIKAKEMIEKLYSTLLNLKIPFIYANFESIELARSAIIALASTKMAFINEIKEICERTDADINVVTKSLRLEKKLGANSLVVSPGIGGSSFPRNMRILLKLANSLGVDLKILDGAIKSNTQQINKIAKKIINMISDDEPLSSKRVTIFGLAYKAQTNDIRESASLLVIKQLLNEGISVYLYDPAYKPNSDYLERIPKNVMENKNFHLTNTAYEAVIQSNILVIMTAWPEFNGLNYEKIKELMCKNNGKQPIILDYKKVVA